MGTKDFFISYSAPDRDQAQEIVEILQSVGLNVFWDKDFPIGTDFVGQIQLGLTTCRRMIAVMSQGYFERPWTSAEWHAFMTKDPAGTLGLLIPIRIEDFEPDGIFASRVYLDFVGLSPQQRRKRLLAAIGMSSKAVQSKTPAKSRGSPPRKAKKTARKKPKP